MIQKYNRLTGAKEVLGTTNASNIVVDDPTIVSGVTSLSNVISKTNAAVQELRGNVKWLYKYGGTGTGGGTGSGSGSAAAQSNFLVTNTNLTISDTDNIIYISDTSMIVKYKIFHPSNNIKFVHSVYVNDILTVNSKNITSNVINQLELANLSVETTNVIRFTAMDSLGFNLTEYVLKIVSGSIVITSSTVQNNGTLSKYYGTGDFSVNFSILNRIKGAVTVLEIKLNNLEEGKVLKTFNTDGTISYNLNVMADLNANQFLEIGTAYNVTAQAITTLGNTSIPSDVYKFTVSLMDSNSLIVTLSDISENSIPDDDLSLKSYLQGSDISFFYTLNAASYNSFKVAFALIDSNGDIVTTIGSILPPEQALDPYDGHDLWLDNKQITKGTSNIFNYSTNRLDNDQVGIFYIHIYAWSSDGTIGPGVGNNAYVPTKIAKCKIIPSTQIVPNYTTSNNTLHLNMNVPLDFSDLQDKNTYIFSSNVIENTEDLIKNTKLDLLLCNNVSSGFIKNKLTSNYPALRVSGGSYAKLYIDYFNGTNPSSWSMNDAGFTISVTFRSDLHSNSNGTIFSYATYDSSGHIVVGTEISLEEAKMVYTESNGTIRTVKAMLIQNVTTVIDFVCEKNISEGTGLMKIYLDGVLTAVDIINDITSLSLGIQKNYALIGCKEVEGELTNFCDTNIYNIRIYKKSLSIPDIIKNYIINYAYLNKDAEDNFDWPAIEIIKARNFINRNWACTIWDNVSNPETWRTGSELYSQICNSPALPVVLLTETNSTNVFHSMSSVSYNEVNGSIAQEYKSPITMEMTNIDGTAKKIIGMEMSLQGTSSMSYSSKNFEIYFGEDVNGKPRLFTPKESWLPENRFTLKADVIDSAHANNTSIGNFINNSGLFDENYAMNYQNNPYASKVKHTLEGFPVYMFIKFGDNQFPTFMGIYNFNLGRGSVYNLGFKVLSSYTLDGEGNNQTYPALVNSYTEAINPYNNGVYSFEINTNSPTDLVGFKQADKTIVDNIVEQRFPERGTSGQDIGWARLYKLYDVLSKMYKDNAPRIYKYEGNNYVPTDNYITTAIAPTMEYFPLTWNNSEGFINWNNANNYFVIAMAFGMVDSLGKNLTLRTWNAALEQNTQRTSGQFYTSFYDMDTALGLDNYGNEEIPPTIYIDYWYNEIVNGYTKASKITNGSISGVKGYDMPNSRLWEVIRDMINRDPGNVVRNYQTVWSDLRKNGGLLSDVDTFINNYYIEHTKNIGEIMYNLDYSIKYLKKYSMQNTDGSYTVGYNDVKFLHGNRKNYVKSWLNKRLKYIDGCMNLAGLYAQDGENNRWVTAYQQSDFKNSPYIEQWSGRGNGTDKATFEFEIMSNIPTIFCMTIATTTQRVVLNDNEITTFTFKGTNASQSTMSWNNTHNISIFKGFNQLNFSSIGLFSMSGLLELDLSNMTSFDNTSESQFSLAALTELRKLNLENTKAVTADSGFLVDAEDCTKLTSINIKNSDVGTLKLPGNTLGTIGAGVLDELLISGSLLNSLSLQNQQFLTSLDFSNCKRLQTVNINTLENLETIIFSNNSLLQEVVIDNCPKLKSIICQNNKNLIVFTIGTCSAIETIILSNCSNTSLAININGAYNLKTLDLSGILSTKNPILPSYIYSISNTFYDTLTTLNLNNSKISAFDFGSIGIGGTFTYNGNTKPILDLSHFNNLNSLNITYNTNVEYIKFNNDSTKPYRLTNSFFYGCTNLKRVFGHVGLLGTSIFNTCVSFYIHEPIKINNVTQTPDINWRGIDTAISGMTTWNANTDLVTNMTYLNTSLNNDFASTSVSLYDVYYILNKADNITNLSSTFYACNKIVTSITDPLKRNTFAHCQNVTNLNSIFIYCNNLKGPLFSVTHTNDNVTQYNGVLSPLTGVTGNGLDNMFYGCGIEYIDDYIFWQLTPNGDKLKISTLNAMFYNYAPKFVVDASASTLVETGGRASKLLIHLPNLTSMSYMFNGCKINFDTIILTGQTENAIYCPLFFANTGLTSITNSFNNLTATGSWQNLFGGQELLRTTYPNNFPKAFNSVRASFTVSSILNGSMVQYPIRNDMFSRIKKSIAVIGGTSLNLTTSTSSFSGLINKTYNPADNNNDVFPYYVFEGCTGLTEAAAFFNKLNYTTNQLIELPGYNLLKNGSILFKDCYKLENLTYAFANMTGVQFKLTSKGFINCNLKNVSHIFEGNTLNLEGKIPYGLFYMETNNIKVKKGWLDGENIYNENYGFNNGTYVIGTPIPTAPNVSISYKSIKNTIIDASSALRGLQGINLNPYTLETGTLTSIADSGDVLRYNEKYNNIKYILNTSFNADTEFPTIENPYYDPADTGSTQTIPNPNYNDHIIIMNPEYDPYYRVWNEWCVDGTNIDSIISGSTIYENVTSLPRILPDNFYDINNNHIAPTSYVGTKLGTMNYILPPDIFRYCYDNSSTSISYFLAESNREGSPGDEVYGLSGRIPPKLFEPLTQITDITGIFKNLKYVCPYSWNYNLDGEEKLGLVYPPDLFKPIGIKLKNTSEIFYGTTIHNKCVIPNNLLYYNTSLQTVERMFSRAIWADSINTQLPSDLFYRNLNISSVSGLFGNSTNLALAGLDMRGPYIMSRNLFTPNHRNINNISYFMNWCSYSTGEVPPFWTWTNLSSANIIGAFNGLDYNKIDNLDDVLASKYASSATNIINKP